MEATFEISLIGTRFACARALRKVMRKPEFRVTRKVQMQKVGWFTWWMYAEFDYREKRK